MADELKDQRIPIMMSPSEVRAIDDWMFSKRLRSRSEAIRQLAQCGLMYESADKALIAAIDFIFERGGKDSSDRKKIFLAAAKNYGDSLRSNNTMITEANEYFEKLDEQLKRTE